MSLLGESQKVTLALQIAEQITAQLGEANEMLVEYVMVMINNGKESADVEADLVELIGDEEAVNFASWLSTALDAIANPIRETTAGDDAADDGAAAPQVENSTPEEEKSTSNLEQELLGKRRRQGGLLMSALAEAERNPPLNNRRKNIFERVGMAKQQKEERAAMRPAERIAVLSTQGEDGGDDDDAAPVVRMPRGQGGHERKLVTADEAAGTPLVFTVTQDTNAGNNGYWEGSKGGKGKGKGGWGKGKGGWGKGKGGGWFAAPQAWSGSKGGKGTSAFSGAQTYIPPGSIYETKTDDAAADAEASTSAPPSTDKESTLPADSATKGKGGGKGKGGKGKGGKGKGVDNRVWVRQSTKEDGLVTPR